MLARNAKEAQSVQDRHFEPADFAELGVDVQRISVARETVDSGLFFGGLLLDHSIRRALRRLMYSGCGTTVSALGVSAKLARAPDEYGALVVENLLAGVCVDGGRALDDDAGGPFIHNLDKLGVCDELSLSGDGVFPYFKELLAVQEHHGGEVGNDVVQVVGGHGVELRDDAEGWVNLEIFVVFEDEGEIGAFGANSEVWSDVRSCRVAGA